VTISRVEEVAKVSKALMILEIMAGDVGFICALLLSFTSLAERSAMIKTDTKLASVQRKAVPPLYIRILIA